MSSDDASHLLPTLTPREREVLDLLRTGLTNGEIGERLDISADGAKYHVSQIIRKLGVRNRYEAARWPEKPRWWAGVAPAGLVVWRGVAKRSGALAFGVAGLLLVSLLVALGLLGFLLLRTDGEETERRTIRTNCPTKPTVDVELPQELTLESVGNVSGIVTACPDHAFYKRSVEIMEEGANSSRTVTESWTDPFGKRARFQSEFTYTSPEVLAAAEAEGVDVPVQRHASIRLKDAQYLSGVGYETPEKLLLPDCGDEDDVGWRPCGDEWWKDADQYSFESQVMFSGRPAVAIVRKLSFEGSEEPIFREPGPYTTTARSYYDAETFLPLGETIRTEYASGEIYHRRPNIEYDFVPLSSLPDDFFDPVSIGHVESEG